jgi:signal peptidase II
VTERCSRINFSLFMLIAVIAAAADQVTKFMAFGLSLTEGMMHFSDVFFERVVFQIDTALNTGAVAGIGQNMNLMFTVLSAAFLVLMIPFFFRVLPQRKGFLTPLAAGLAYGGVLGNFIDRLTMTAVRDFISVGFVYDTDRVAMWPTFNIADACICAGVSYFAFVVLFEKERPAEGIPA